MNRKIETILILSFGIFGLTALIYQVSFAKNLVLLFGLTAPAIATVLAVYFSGLALGSFIFGKLVDRLMQNFKHYLLYISLFAAVGIYGFSVPFLFQILGKVILWINQIYPLDFSGFNFFAFLLSFLFLIIPAILIGGGFPIISKIFIRESETLGKKISLLYFVNTFGSVFGALISGFWLIPAIGVKMTLFSASGLNLAIGGCLIWKIKHLGLEAKGGEYQAKRREGISVNQRSYQRESASIKNNLFVYILFLTGFLALALEVFYTKTLILFLGSSTYAFSLVLIVFLLGIALGSLIISPYLDRLKRGFLFFGLFSGLLGFWLFITLKIFEKLPFFYLKILQWFYHPQFLEQPNFSTVIFTQSSILFLTIFPVTLLMGMIFPLLIKLANPDSWKIGEGVGRLYFANTLGGVLGSLLAGFFILPNLGFQKSLVLILLIYLILAISFLIKERRIGNLSKNTLTSLFIGFLVFAIFSSSWSKKVLIIGIFPYALNYLGMDEKEIRQELDKIDLLFYKEGLSQVAVMKTDNILSLKINGKVDASNALEDVDIEILTGALPLILHPDPKEILIIGLGSGITLGAVNQFDSLNKIEVVEIDPKVIEASQYFKDYNHNALQDPRVKTILADARNYLYLTDKKYDVISSALSNPWVSGNSYLFTKEYYQLVKNHLKEGGLVLQWIHCYNFWPEDLKTVFKTFAEVFPQAYLFESFFAPDLLLVGAENENSILNSKTIDKKFKEEKIQKELERIYIKNPYDLLARLVGENKAIGEEVQDSKIHTDDKSLLEFSAPKAIYQKTIANNLEILLRMREKTKENLEFLKEAEIEEVSKYFSFRENWILAEIAFSKGDVEEAVAFYEKAQETGLSHPWLDFSMQEALKQRK